MEESTRLAGGNAGGAVRVGDTVRREAGPWTPAVQALLGHLRGVGFRRAPIPLGLDEVGRDVQSFLPGETIGEHRPWPTWVHSDDALVQVATWLQEYHAAVDTFRPPDGAVWREGGQWRPGLIIGHNDAAPYNAAWSDGQLVGFFDWDFAAPVSREWDLAFAAFSWVPLHARRVVEDEGFTAFADRARRLRLFLHVYGWTGLTTEFVDLIRARVTASADGIGRIATAGDPAYRTMIAAGVDGALRAAVTELAESRGPAGLTGQHV